MGNSLNMRRSRGNDSDPTLLDADYSTGLGSTKLRRKQEKLKRKVQNTMANEVFIDGDANAIQLRVQGHSAQDVPLQTWENNAADVLAQVTEDGRLQVGDTTLMTTNESLVEAHAEGTSSSIIQRG